MVFKLEPLNEKDILKVLKLSLEKEEGLENYNIKIEEVFPKSNENRSEEVLNHIRKNEIKNFVILDDEPYKYKETPLLLNHWVRTITGSYHWIPIETQGFNKTKLVEALVILKNLKFY